MRIPVDRIASALPELKKLKETSHKIDAMFLKQLLEQMQKNSKAFGDGPGADVYRDLFNQSIAESVSKGAGLGIGDMMYRAMAPKIWAKAVADQTSTTSENS